MRIILLSTVLALALACGEAGNNTEPEKNADTLQQTPAPGPVVSACNCYLEVLQRDTMVAALVFDGNSVSGRLTFDNFEKDASSGSVQGTREGDIIKGWYSFASEGMNSVMEVYFKIEGDNLVRGLGPVQSKGDSAYFSEPGKIEYDNKQVFAKVPCESLLEKFRCR